MTGFTKKMLATISVMMVLGLSPARAEVLYDNTQTSVGIDHCPSSTEIGDEITLAGTSRVVTQLDLAFTGPIGNVDVVVRLRANDGDIDFTLGTPKPGTILFDSGTLTVAATNNGFNTFSVDIPNVTVPNSFTWTIQRVGGPSICIPRYDPTTIGSSDAFFFWVNNLGVSWFPEDNNPQNNLYARVVSVDPIQLLTELAQTVMMLNVQNGIANSLDAKLDAALGALDDVNENNDVAAVNSLNAFISAVEAQRGNKITNEDADDLNAAVQEIIDLLNGS